MTMTDLAMNVDPTDSDTWTFVTNDSDEAYYYLFDDDGACQDGTPGAIDRDLEGIDDNLYLTIDPAKDGSMVLDFRVPHKGSQQDDCSNANSRAATLIDRDTDSNPSNDANMVTFIEGDPGVFMNTDTDADVPNIAVSTTAARGNTAVVDHNDSEMSVVVGHAFATITIDDDAVGGVWNSGEEVPVTLTDADMNKKAMVDEDFDLSNPEFTLIPSVRIGSPITLASADSVMIDDRTLTGMTGSYEVDAFSDIVRLKPNVTASTVTVNPTLAHWCQGGGFGSLIRSVIIVSAVIVSMGIRGRPDLLFM